MLALNPQGMQRAQALAWLRQCYESLRDVDIWSLWLLYDEACVQAAPHTSLGAQSCYARWERGMLEENSGNSGMSLPPELQVPRARAAESLAARAPLAPQPKSTTKP